MARGFLDDDEIRAITGGDLDISESFDPVEKSIGFIKEAELAMSEIALLQYDLKEIWGRAREYGLDVDVLKAVIKRRKKARHEVEEHDVAVGNLELRMDGLNIDGEDYDAEDTPPKRPDPDAAAFDIL